MWFTVARIATRTTSNSQGIDSVTMEKLFFHEGGEGSIVKLITNVAKVELPLGEHETIEGLLDGSLSNKEVGTT